MGSTQVIGSEWAKPIFSIFYFDLIYLGPATDTRFSNWPFCGNIEVREIGNGCD